MVNEPLTNMPRKSMGIVFSTNSAGATRNPHEKWWKWTPVLHYI